MKSSSGQTLVEMVIAVGMVSLVLVAVVSGVTISIRNSRFSKNKALATRYAQEGIERFRAYRDEYGWIPFFEELGGVVGPTSFEENYCFPDFPTTLVEVSTYEGVCASDSKIGLTEYVRNADIEVYSFNNEEWVNVEITISWFEGAASHDVTLSTKLHDWTKQ